MYRLITTFKSWGRENDIYLIVFLLACVLIIPTHHLVGITNDSLAYEAAANSWRSSWELLDQHGEAYAYWTPLYPVILSLIPEGKINPFFKALHIPLWLLTILIWVYIGRRYFNQKRFLFLFSISLCLSFELFQNHIFLWSETLFIFLMTVYFLAFHKVIQEKRKYWLVIFYFAAFFMLVQRNTGIFIFFPTFIFLIALTQKKLFPIWQLFIHTLSSWGFIIWHLYLRIYTLKQDALFHKIATIDFFRYFKEIIGTTAIWLVPHELPNLIRSFGMVIILASIIYFLYKEGKDYFKILLGAILVFYYVIWLIIPSSHTDTIRYMSVIVPIFFFLFFRMIEEIASGYLQQHQHLIFIILLLWLVYPISRMGYHFWVSVI